MRFVFFESRMIAAPMSILQRRSTTSLSLKPQTSNVKHLSAFAPARNTDRRNAGCRNVLAKQRPRFRKKQKRNGFCWERKTIKRLAKRSPRLSGKIVRTELDRQRWMN